MPRAATVSGLWFQGFERSHLRPFQPTDLSARDSNACGQAGRHPVSERGFIRPARVMGKGGVTVVADVTSLCPERLGAA